MSLYTLTVVFILYTNKCKKLPVCILVWRITSLAKALLKLQSSYSHLNLFFSPIVCTTIQHQKQSYYLILYEWIFLITLWFFTNDNYINFRVTCDCAEYQLITDMWDYVKCIWLYFLQRYNFNLFLITEHV